MNRAKRATDVFRTKLKQGSCQWIQGFKEACSLHRVFIICLRSKKVLIRTGQCFLLNGLIFLGSILVVNSIVNPTLLWILPDQISDTSFQEPCSVASILRLYSILRSIFAELFYFLWFYPLYLFSFILSTLWYNDIAEHGFAAMETSDQLILEPQSQNTMSSSEKILSNQAPQNLGWIMIGIGEQVYSILLSSFFFLEVYAMGFVPYIGKAMNFLLLSWMYAYFSFEYKWNFSKLTLERRLNFFESNWAFFSGFGSPCVLAVFFCSPLVGYGVMAVLFPLFVLAATCSRAEEHLHSQMKTSVIGLGRLPIFYVADKLLIQVLTIFSMDFTQESGSSKQS